MAVNLSKVINFEGKVGQPLRAPDTFRRWSAGSKKLLRLWYRVKRDELWWPQLVKELAVATLVYKSIGEQMYAGKISADPTLYKELEAVLAWDTKKNLGTTVIEETRDRVQGFRCAMCRTQLKFPAYVVTRQGQLVVNKSKATGIHCLRFAHGKLSKFLQSVELRDVVAKLQTIAAADPELRQAIEALFDFKYAGV